MQVRLVLNASRHHRKNRGKRLPLIQSDKGAQRLAASQEKSPMASLLNEGGVKCSTPRGITGKIAPACFARKSVPPTCSTPRGITGKIALGYCSSRAGANVLNASRHHRKNRSIVKT